MSATATKPLYVYGVTSQPDLPQQLAGISRGRLALITRDGLSAIVSTLPGDLTLEREAVNTHAEVLAEIQKAGPVLPVRFGVVLQDAHDVEERLIAPHSESFRRQLRYLTGKVELRLRATYDEDAVLREVVAENAEVAALKASLHGNPADATYYARIRLGELVVTALEQRRKHDAAQLLAALDPFCVELRAAEAPHPRVALQVSILAERCHLDELDQVVEGLGAAHASRMRLTFTGPLPPYSFVEVTTA